MMLIQSTGVPSLSVMTVQARSASFAATAHTALVWFDAVGDHVFDACSHGASLADPDFVKTWVVADLVCVVCRIRETSG